jgi:hypothetical protein
VWPTCPIWSRFCGITDLLKLPKTTRAEFAKDPAAERGKVLKVSGTIVQIQREGPLFVGILSDDLRFVSFFTPGRTAGIVDGSTASFVGVAMQKFSYTNAVGGQTEAVLVVGRFVGQADSDPPLLPAEKGPAKTGPTAR